LSWDAIWYDIEPMSRRIASRLALALFIFLSMRLSAQEFSPGAAQVRKLEEKWTEAYKQRNIDILSTLLAEDFVITVEDGATYSKAGYITHSVDPTVQIGVAEQSDMRIRVRGGNIAVVTGAYYERGQSKHKPYEYHDRFTDVWVRVGNTWRVLSSHYSIPMK
jgi:ketosteroid isomerase-like protein